MAVAVDGTNGFRADAPRVLFEGAYVEQGVNGPMYDVAPDGEHFVFVGAARGEEGGRDGRLILVENFFEELKRLVPN